MPIMTGAHPKALIAAMARNVETAGDNEPLAQVADRFTPKPRKPPKMKKAAFGPPQHGAAFKK